MNFRLGGLRQGGKYLVEMSNATTSTSTHLFSTTFTITDENPLTMTALLDWAKSEYQETRQMRFMAEEHVMVLMLEGKSALATSSGSKSKAPANPKMYNDTMVIDEKFIRAAARPMAMEVFFIKCDLADRLVSTSGMDSVSSTSVFDLQVAYIANQHIRCLQYGEVPQTCFAPYHITESKKKEDTHSTIRQLVGCAAAAIADEKKTNKNADVCRGLIYAALTAARFAHARDVQRRIWSI